MWSKVIGGLILAVIFWGWHEFSAETLNYIVSFLPLSSWILIIVTLVIVIIMYKAHKHIKPIFQKKVITKNEDEAIAILNNWWPKEEGYRSPSITPNDITVDFTRIEQELKLENGLVSKVIDRVADNNCYILKTRGNNCATYKYNHDKTYGPW